MKPVVINITNLVGTIIVIGDNTNEMTESVTKALQQVLNQVQENQELNQDKLLKQSLDPENLNQDSQ